MDRRDWLNSIFLANVGTVLIVFFGKKYGFLGDHNFTPGFVGLCFFVSNVAALVINNFGPRSL
jgi:hypothetical protein